MLIALLTLFAWSFLATTVLPLSSEAPLIVYARSYGQVALPVLVGDRRELPRRVYRLLARAAQALGKGQAPEESRSRRSAGLLRRFGQPVLLLSTEPLICFFYS